MYFLLHLLARLFGTHLYRHVDVKGANCYWQCTVCGARDWSPVSGIVGPLDVDWLSGKEKNLHRAEKLPRLPPKGGSGIAPPH